MEIVRRENRGMMKCKACIYGIIDNVTDNYSGEVYREMCCHRYAPRMINGAGTGFTKWRWPQVSPDNYCGEWKQKENEER